jgi:hypothetical protein
LKLNALALCNRVLLRLSRHEGGGREELGANDLIPGFGRQNGVTPAPQFYWSFNNWNGYAAQDNDHSG